MPWSSTNKSSRRQVGKWQIYKHQTENPQKKNSKFEYWIHSFSFGINFDYYWSNYSQGKPLLLISPVDFNI